MIAINYRVNLCGQIHRETINNFWRNIPLIIDADFILHKKHNKILADDLDWLIIH